jgi:hypothetical protein
MDALLTSEVDRSRLDTNESRERFLHWHYRHTRIYLRLRELAFAEYRSSKKPLTINELITLYEEEQLLLGLEVPRELREYAHHYQNLLSSSFALWKLFLPIPSALRSHLDL